MIYTRYYERINNRGGRNSIGTKELQLVVAKRFGNVLTRIKLSNFWPKERNRNLIHSKSRVETALQLKKNYD